MDIKEYLVEVKTTVKVKVPAESSEEYIKKAALSDLNSDLQFGFVTVDLNFSAKIIKGDDKRT